MIYTLHNKTLYISSHDKKTIILNYLKDTSNEDVIIQSEFIDINQFIDRIDIIKETRIKTKNSIHNVEKTIYSDLNNIFGKESPDSFEVKTKYNNRKFTEPIKNIIRKLYKDNKEDKVETFVCTGYDNNSIEQTFSIDKYTKSIKIDIKLDENKMYDPNAVKQKLINEIYAVDKNV